MRSFIAIQLPEEIRNIISNIKDELKQTQADVKWVKPENIHLTLKFLGDIEQDLINKVSSIIKGFTQKSSSFNLCLSSLGAFPKLQYARVIWIGLTNDKRVSEIAKNLERELLKIGLSSESRPFSSHITLGRVRSGLNRKALVEKLEFLNKNLSFPSPEFKVSSITLFKSTLTPQGPIYEVILDCPLSSNSTLSS